MIHVITELTQEKGRERERTVPWSAKSGPEEESEESIPLARRDRTHVLHGLVVVVVGQHVHCINTVQRRRHRRSRHRPAEVRKDVRVLVNGDRAGARTENGARGKELEETDKVGEGALDVDGGATHLVEP